jgi:hypothetical protein
MITAPVLVLIEAVVAVTLRMPETLTVFRFEVRRTFRVLPIVALPCGTLSPPTVIELVVELPLPVTALRSSIL